MEIFFDNLHMLDLIHLVYHSLIQFDRLTDSSKPILGCVFHRSLFDEIQLALVVDIDHIQSIQDEILFDKIIEWSISAKTRCMVNLDELGFKSVGE